MGKTVHTQNDPWTSPNRSKTRQSANCVCAYFLGCTVSLEPKSCDGANFVVHRNGKAVRVTVPVFTGDVEACLKRFHWKQGLSPWQNFRLDDESPVAASDNKIGMMATLRFETKFVQCMIYAASFNEPWCAADERNVCASLLIEIRNTFNKWSSFEIYIHSCSKCSLMIYLIYTP